MPNVPAERTAAALASLAAALRQTSTDLQRLVERTDGLADQVRGGAALKEAMPLEARPLIITKLVEITDRLHEAGGAVRRAEAEQLRAEGCTHEQIAEIFGVTRQRVAQLLGSPTVKQPTKRRR